MRRRSVEFRDAERKAAQRSPTHNAKNAVQNALPDLATIPASHIMEAAGVGADDLYIPRDQLTETRTGSLVYRATGSDTEHALRSAQAMPRGMEYTGPQREIRMTDGEKRELARMERQSSFLSRHPSSTSGIQPV